MSPLLAMTHVGRIGQIPQFAYGSLGNGHYKDDRERVTDQILQTP